MSCGAQSRRLLECVFSSHRCCFSSFVLKINFLVVPVGQVLEEELHAGHDSGIGKLKQAAIDAWRFHGQHPFDSSELTAGFKLKKMLRQLDAEKDAAVSVAKQKQQTSSKPKFAVSWLRQVKILGHRSFWFVAAFINSLSISSN